MVVHEQVRSTGSGDVVYVVKATSQVDGPLEEDLEPFAIAARRQVTPLQAPRPAITLTAPPAIVRPGTDVTIAATITNPSSDLTAQLVSAQVQLPQGVELAPGSAPATTQLGTLNKNGDAGDEATVTWIDRLTPALTFVGGEVYGFPFSSEIW